MASCPTIKRVRAVVASVGSPTISVGLKRTVLIVFVGTTIVIPNLIIVRNIEILVLRAHNILEKLLCLKT